MFTRTKRSSIMSAVRGGNTQPEWRIRRALFARGFRYRVHWRDLPETPDIVFGPARVAVFVHGCFWHGHSCPRGTLPATNRAFWRKKLAANSKRDRRDRRRLRELGWRTLAIWECTIRSEAGVPRGCARIIAAVSNQL